MMKMQNHEPIADRSKVVPIAVLSVTALLIVFLGAALSIYSIVNGISYPVMNFQVHGAVWGTAILFLGARYFFSVRKLKTEVYQSPSGFSWNNFKSEKVQIHGRNKPKP